MSYLTFSSSAISTPILLLAGLLVGDALAAPAPSFIEGDPLDGGEILLLGTGFGEKTQAAPILFDTQGKVWINGQLSEPYAGVPDGTPINSVPGKPWNSGGEGDLVIADQDTFPVYKGTFGPNAKQNAWIGEPQGFPDPALGEVTELYVRWYWKATFDPDGSGGSNKFIRIWDTPGGNDIGVRISWTNMHLTYDNGGPSWSHTSPSVNQWHLMEIYVQTTPNPSIQAYVDGVLQHSISNFSPDAGFQGLHPRLWGIDGSANGQGDPDWSGETVWLADYFADSTRARVEIGDAPIWSDVVVREPQIPIEWSNTEIRFTVYEGRLAPLGTRYVYVVDKDGNVNELGIPLDGSMLPGPPALLTVN